METGELRNLDLDEIQKLDSSNRTDYLALRRMYESDGWRLFMQWLALQASQLLRRQLTGKTWDDVLVSRGGRGMCDTVASIENITEVTYRQIAEREADMEESLSQS